MKKIVLSIALIVNAFLSFSQNNNSNKMENFSVREQIIETVNRLFNHTDAQNWAALQQEVFASDVVVDMTSLGMPEVKKMSANDLCAMWQNGFAGLDAVFHLAGNHAVTFKGDSADVFCYSAATHYKKAALNGKTRTFNGSYDLHLVKTNNGWRIDTFKYNLKYTEGNVELN